MANNPLSELLTTMQARTWTLGWGAVAAFSRAHLNAVLEQQFIDGFNLTHLLPAFSGVVPLDSQGILSARFDQIVFGPPRVSFESSRLGSQRATLSLSLVSGDFTVVERHAGQPRRLNRTSRITEGMGFALSMEVILGAYESEAEHGGEVVISLTEEDKDPNPRCNLMDEPLPQIMIGRALQQHVLAQSGFKTRYTLMLPRAGSYAPLSPVQFAMCTQPAPGATVANAPNAGDGAVLVFMKLKAWDNDPDGVPSPGSTFPYFIPDDTVQGQPLYSAALVIAEQLANLADDTQLQVLKSQLLPPSHVFEEVSNGRHYPRDVLVLGNLVPAPNHVSIHPKVISLGQGRSQTFTARRGNGGTVGDVTWSSRCVDTPTASGRVSAAGLFEAPAQSVLGRHALPTVVTAHYWDRGFMRETSAVVMTRFEPLNVAPLASVRGAEEGAAVVSLTASSVDGGPLEWRLVEPSVGTLEVTGPGRAVYQPPAALDVPLVVQRIEIRDTQSGQSVQAAVILTGVLHSAEISPEYGDGLVGRGAVSLQIQDNSIKHLLDAAGVPEAERRNLEWTWTLHGDGDVVSGGMEAQYSPPSTLSSSPVSVVTCSTDIPGWGMVHGLTVLQIAERQQEIPKWETIHEFSIIPSRSTEVLANGMQQVPLLVRIVTNSVTWNNEEWDVPISGMELATLRFKDAIHHTYVPVIPASQEGILHNSPYQWAVSDARNRFRTQDRRTPEVAAAPIERSEADRTVQREIWFHMTAPVDREFYAEFLDHRDQYWDSRDKGGAGYETVNLRGLPVPTKTRDDYYFERTRVWNSNEPPEGVEEDFHFILESTDMWTLRYEPDRGMRDVGFSTFEAEHNTSIIQWESELMDEVFFSCTGYAFYGIDHNHRPPIPQQLEFDPYLKNLHVEQERELPPDTLYGYPAPGELVISLHREANMRYWHDGMANGRVNMDFRQKLDKPMVFILRDEEGSRHHLRISFNNPVMSDSRNTLLLLPQ